MQIVIDIQEGFIDKMNSIKDDRELSWAQLLTVYRAFHAMLQNGISLPKGHGRLIDDSNLMTVTDYDGENEKTYIPYDEIENAPTIIEADKEGEE